MFGLKASYRRGGKEEAEKPFWISFSDLMTALMVLFLVSMAVALIAVTQGPAAAKQVRQEAITSCIAHIEDLTTRDEFKGVTVQGNLIEFGTLAQFKNNDHRLDADQERFIRAFVPKVLEVARQKSCEQWLKRVVVEGFASQVGSYLYNLNLSYLRSQRILCALLNSQAENALSIEDRKQIRMLFLAGGSSFNTAAKEADQMRRAELRLEFWDLEAQKEKAREIPWDEDATCPNDLK